MSFVDTALVMASIQSLQLEGWYLSAEGLDLCTEDGKTSVNDVIKVALDLDLKQIGERHLPDGLTKGKLETVDGPFVLQIQKIRNVTAPKDNEESQAAPQMLKLTLSDGHSACTAIETAKIRDLSLNTPPGTKLRLEGKVGVQNGFILLKPTNCRVLGGRVEKMVENWEVKRKLANNPRPGSEGGPPPFVPFGHRNRQQQAVQSNLNTKDNFKSLETKKTEKEKNESDEFEQQRRATIAEALQSKSETKAKSFTKPVSDKDVAQIVEMGFTPEQANTALKQTNSLDEAISSLLSEKENRYSRNRRGGPMDRRDRPERPGGRGRRRGGDEDDDYDRDRSGKPPPVSLFDFLPSKIKAKDVETKQNDETQGYDDRRNKSGDSNSDKRGLFNLPPRLQKQQQRKMEEQAQRNQRGMSRQSSGDSDKKNDNRGSRGKGQVNGHEYADDEEPPPYPQFEQQGFRQNYNNKYNKNNYYDNRPQNRRQYSDRNDRRQGGNRRDNRHQHKYDNSNEHYNDEQSVNGTNSYIMGIPSNELNNTSNSKTNGKKQHKGEKRSQQAQQQQQQQQQQAPVEQQPQPVADPGPPPVQYHAAPVNDYTYVQDGSMQGYKQQMEGIHKRQWKPQDFCLAKFYEDGQFYRATINSVDYVNQSCSCTFTDYGNTETVMLSDIRAVPKQAWETNNIQPPTNVNSVAPMMVPASVPMATIAMNAPMATQPGNPEQMVYCSVPMSVPIQGTNNMSVPGILVQGPPSIPMGSVFPADQAAYQGQINPYQVTGAPAMSMNDPSNPGYTDRRTRPVQQYYIPPGQRQK